MRHSSGIIVYRKRKDGRLEYLVGKPGCVGTNEYWSYFKGGIENGEDLRMAAVREFREETGVVLTKDEILSMVFIGTVRQNKKKLTSAFSLEKSDIDIAYCQSNIADNCSWPEIAEYAWKTYDELTDVTHPTHVSFYREIENTHGGTD